MKVERIQKTKTMLDTTVTFNQRIKKFVEPTSSFLNVKAKNSNYSLI